MPRSVWVAAAVLAATISYEVSAHRQLRQAEPFAGVLYEHPAIQYARAPVNDPVARLLQSLAARERSLAYREQSGYLPAVLEALGISPQSQVLVFSKTGIQRAMTSPKNPRALYFNDSVVVGFIPGAPLLEIASHDPQLGVIFYTINQLPPANEADAASSSSRTIVRRTNCLSCHVSETTMDVPGMMARSMFVAPDGEVLPQLGAYLVDHRTPLTHRWGGWFVTGNYVQPPYGGVGHMGNVTTTLHPTSRPAGTSNEILIEWLDSRPEARGYESSESDIAALMVFDHQMRAINLLTRLNWEARVAAHGGRVDVSAEPLQRLVDDLVDYFLFVGEAPPPARLTARADFAKRFMAPGPRDRAGRSLRELDLETRLLRYPCSYMIDSDAFRGLTAPAKRAVYSRLAAILQGRDTAAKYAHLSAVDRRAVLEILRDTGHDLQALGPRPQAPDHRTGR